MHILEELPAELAIEVLRCAPIGLTSQLRQLLPHRLLISLVVLAACPGLAACCKLPSDCCNATPDAPTLTLCVDVGQDDDDATEATPTPPQATGGGEADSFFTQDRSIWLRYDQESDPFNFPSLFSLQQRRQVVACRLLARAPSLQGTKITLPRNACLILTSGSDTLALEKPEFTGTLCTVGCPFQGGASSGLRTMIYNLSAIVSSCSWHVCTLNVILG